MFYIVCELKIMAQLTASQERELREAFDLFDTGMINKN